jgi:hypothetical protein
MTQAKKEDGDRDRFVEYLKLTEGIEYETVDVDVKLSSGKDFDYLLKASTGESLALEITWLTDKDETHPDKDQHHDFVRDAEKFKRLVHILDSLISKEGLPCSICIGVSYHVPFTMKELNRLPAAKLASIKNQLLAVLQSLSEGDSVSVPTDIGNLQISCNAVGHDVYFYSIGGTRGGIFNLEYFIAKLRAKMPGKNQQLDYKAHRRVLLFRNTISMTWNDPITRLVIMTAVTDFIQLSPADVSNIDEIYADFSMNKFERVYPMVAQ